MDMSQIAEAQRNSLEGLAELARESGDSDALNTLIKIAEGHGLVLDVAEEKSFLELFPQRRTTKTVSSGYRLQLEAIEALGKTGDPIALEYLREITQYRKREFPYYSKKNGVPDVASGSMGKTFIFNFYNMKGELRDKMQRELSSEDEYDSRVRSTQTDEWQTPKGREYFDFSEYSPLYRIIQASKERLEESIGDVEE